MGLLLSVLVISVGVVEALSCYNRLRLGYLPLNGRQPSQTSSNVSNLDKDSLKSPSEIADDGYDSELLNSTEFDVSDSYIDQDNDSELKKENIKCDNDKLSTCETTFELSEISESKKNSEVKFNSLSKNYVEDKVLRKTNDGNEKNMHSFCNSELQDSQFDSSLLSSLDPNFLQTKLLTGNHNVQEGNVSKFSKTMEDSINLAENIHFQKSNKLKRSISEPLFEGKVITGRLQFYSNSMSMDEGLNTKSILAKHNKQSPKKKVRFNLDTVQICFEKDSVTNEKNSLTTDIIVQSRLPINFQPTDDVNNIFTENTNGSNNAVNKVNNQESPEVFGIQGDQREVENGTSCTQMDGNKDSLTYTSNDDVTVDSISLKLVELNEASMQQPSEKRPCFKPEVSFEIERNDLNVKNTSEVNDELIRKVNLEKESEFIDVQNDYRNSNFNISVNDKMKANTQHNLLKDSLEKEEEINGNSSTLNCYIADDGACFQNVSVESSCKEKELENENHVSENALVETKDMVEEGAAGELNMIRFHSEKDNSSPEQSSKVLDQPPNSIPKNLDISIKTLAEENSNEPISNAENNSGNCHDLSVEENLAVPPIKIEKNSKNINVKKLSDPSKSGTCTGTEEINLQSTENISSIFDRDVSLKSRNEVEDETKEEVYKMGFKHNKSTYRECKRSKSKKKYQEESGTESEEDWNVEEVSDGVETESDGETAQVEPSTSRGKSGQNLADDKNAAQKAFWLIFSGEYTKAMSKDWHSSHFCCWQCDESLTGQRYVLRDDHPYCIKCYESVFANSCEECSRVIGIDSKDLSYKDKHWHEACFLCSKCRVSLVDKQFGSKADKIYCGNCYDAQFASRCDGCGQIFRAGTKKMEYKTRQWHEQCFCCCVCKTPIGTKSFIPREQEIYCATCYEEKFATRCVKCNKIITSGGVTYKNEPWHRECFTCTNCGTSLAGQRFTSREDKPYCADCFGELFAKRCTACCKPITGIGGTRFISFEDRHWHNDCFICAACKTSLVGRGFITDGEDIICPECAKQKLM